MATRYGRLVALVTHARDVSAVDRDRFSVDARGWSAAHAGFVLETCHRVEAYGVAAGELSTASALIPPGGRFLVDEAVVRHSIAVAVGQDSVVIGEDQVLHQLREAIASARAGARMDPTLERLFSGALRAGRRARSWRQGPALSVADLAIAAIERRVGPLDGSRLLVVGAGQMGELALRAGLAAGAIVSIASRSANRAAVVASRVGGQARPFDPGVAVADLSAIIIALRGPWQTSAVTVEALLAGLSVVVDLSVPSAVSEEVATALGGRFVSADALVRIEAALPRPGGVSTVGRLEELIASVAAEFVAWSEAQGRRAAAAALTAQAERERTAELAELWRRLPPLDPEARNLIEGMSRHLAARLLREPLEHLGQDPDGRHERAVRELFGL